MVETGAYGERMAGYLHLTKPPLYALLGSGRAELAVTRLHAPNGFSDPTSPIPLQKAFSIHLHLRANQGGRLWLSGKFVPTGKRPSGGVTILDLEQDPIAFFPNPIARAVVEIILNMKTSLTQIPANAVRFEVRINPVFPFSVPILVSTATSDHGYTRFEDELIGKPSEVG